MSVNQATSLGSILEYLGVPENTCFTRFDSHGAGGLRIKFNSHPRTEKSAIESFTVNSKKINPR